MYNIPMRWGSRLSALTFAALLAPLFSVAQDGAATTSIGSPAESPTPAKGKKDGRKKPPAKKAAPRKKKKIRGERLREPGEALGGHKNEPLKKVEKTPGQGRTSALN